MYCEHNVIHIRRNGAIVPCRASSTDPGKNNLFDHFHPTSLGLSTITIDNSLVYTHIQQSLYHHITHKAFVERPGETLEVDTAILQDGISWITFGKARTSCPSLIVSFRYIFTLLLFHPAFLTQRNNGTILPAQSPSSAQENHSAIEQHPLIVPIR